MGREALTADERETHLILHDADPTTASIYTAQRPMMERLGRHPLARQAAEHRLNGRLIALEFEIPAACLVILKRPRRSIWSGLVQAGRRGSGPGRVSPSSGPRTRLSRSSRTRTGLSGEEPGP